MGFQTTFPGMPPKPDDPFPDDRFFSYVAELPPDGRVAIDTVLARLRWDVLTGRCPPFRARTLIERQQLRVLARRRYPGALR